MDGAKNVFDSFLIYEILDTIILVKLDCKINNDDDEVNWKFLIMQVCKLVALYTIIKPILGG